MLFAHTDSFVSSWAFVFVRFVIHICILCVFALVCFVCQVDSSRVQPLHDGGSLRGLGIRTVIQD